MRSLARLEGSIRRGADVAAVERDRRRVARHARRRIAASTPTRSSARRMHTAAARLLRRIDSRLADHLGYITYASAATVNLTWRAADFPKPPDAFGFVVPAIEHRKIIAGSFSSLKFEGRAPQGFILARVFLGGVLQSDMMNLSDDEMIAAAREEFRALLGVTATPGHDRGAPLARGDAAICGRSSRSRREDRGDRRAAFPICFSPARRIAASACPIACTAASLPPKPRSNGSRSQLESFHGARER